MLSPFFSSLSIPLLLALLSVVSLRLPLRSLQGSLSAWDLWEHVHLTTTNNETLHIAAQHWKFSLCSQALQRKDIMEVRERTAKPPIMQTPFREVVGSPRQYLLLAAAIRDPPAQVLILLFSSETSSRPEVPVVRSYVTPYGPGSIPPIP